MTALVSFSSRFESWPPAIADAPAVVHFTLEELFTSRIDNPHTRRAYQAAARDFFMFAATRPGGDDLGAITSLHIAAWKAAMKARGLSVPTIKLRLTALTKLFQVLVADHILIANPAAIVDRPRHSVTSGLTPVIDAAEVACILSSIDVSTLIGLRDRALIATMAYTFARVSAVCVLRVESLFRQKQRLWLRIHDKGGKAKDIPCHDVLESHLTDWLEASGLSARPGAFLFPTMTWRIPDDTTSTRRHRDLSTTPMSQALTWDMVQRRARAAGIETRICNHTFRAAGITAFLANGGTIERAAHIAGHASTRTTQLYDRRPTDVTLDEIERIRFGAAKGL